MSTEATPALQEIPQGDLRLLDTDLARLLLASDTPARVAYVAPDGTPRGLRAAGEGCGCR